MQFVTLTTDWRKEDYYTGAIKGKILSTTDHVNIVGITHQVKPHNIAEAAFIIRNSYHHFPEGSIHIITVGTSGSAETGCIAARINNHIFLMGDNGIIGLLGDVKPGEVVSLGKNSRGLAFPSLYILAEAAKEIISGKKLSELGDAKPHYQQQIPLRATLENNTITGTVIYIDSFGNAITNISKELFERIGKSRDFEIFVQSKHYRLTEMSQAYTDTSPGDLLALFNSVDLLEISIRNGSAASLLNLNTDSTVRIEFKET